MKDKPNKFFDEDRYCEVYVGTVNHIYVETTTPLPVRTVFIKPDDKKEKWLIIDSCMVEISIGTRVELCCWNGSIRLASRKSKNYIVTNAQIIHLNNLSPVPELPKGIIDMTKEQALIRYIKHMNKGMFGYDEKSRAYYVGIAREKLKNLRFNKQSDPDRYNALETEREGIRQNFLGEGYPHQADFNKLYERFDAIDNELTARWQVKTDENLPNLFNLDNLT